MSMAPKKKPEEIEWVGGILAMPAYVMDEREPYRPEVLLWVSSERAVLGTSVGKPGGLLGQACESLQSTIDRPMVGPPHAPASVRVASPDLAAALRAGHPGVDVVCAPTPEIAAMGNELGGGEEGEQSYLSAGIGADIIARFFHAAADLFRARPWKTVPTDQSLLSVTIDKLGVKNAVISVIGQLGESVGLVGFSGVDDFDDYLAASALMELGEEPEVPPHFSLTFDRGPELSPALRKEIADHRWEVASADAYPSLFFVDADLVARPPTGTEVAITEAIALALAKVLEEKKALFAAWGGGEAVFRTLSVTTHVGDVEVSLRVPPERQPVRYRYRPSDDVIEDLRALGQDGDGIDPEERGQIENEIMRQFVASPEAKELTDVHSCHLVMDYAADYFGATIATLRPRDLEEIVFEIIPRKVSTDASAARGIVADNRALFAFLKREFELKQADACLRVLGGDAVKKLGAALSDAGNFGMAKSLVMAAREAGVDVSSKEGIEAWMRLMQSRAILGSDRSAAPEAASRPVSSARARANKDRRKAARNARKKNR